MVKKDFDTWNTLKKRLEKKQINTKLFFHEREIWWCALGLNVGVESDGKNNVFERPVVIIKKFNGEMVWVLPLTSSSKNKKHFCLLPHTAGTSYACLTQIRTVSSKRLLRKMSTVSEGDFKQLLQRVTMYLDKVEPRTKAGFSEAEATNAFNIPKSSDKSIRVKHYFHLDQEVAGGEVVTITDTNQVQQIGKVLRMRVGDSIGLVGTNKVGLVGEIKTVSKERVEILLGVEQLDLWMPAKQITLYQSVVKKDKFELIAQKATEIGVTKIVPVLSERTEKTKLDTDRLEKIIKEAAEQSHRADVPELSHDIVSFEDVIGSGEKLVALHMSGIALNAYSKEELVALISGPEGGWGEKDFELFAQYNVPTVSLGKGQVLRAETAPIAALAVLLL